MFFYRYSIKIQLLILYEVHKDKNEYGNSIRTIYRL